MTDNILYRIESDVVFYTVSANNQTHIDLKNGTKVGYGFDGAILSIPDAMSWYQEFNNRFTGLTTKQQIKANIDLSSTILSIVRNDLINLSMTDAIVTLSAMRDIIFMVQLGLFNTAAALLDSTPRTTILTDELLNRYAAMLRSSDAIK